MRRIDFKIKDKYETGRVIVSFQRGTGMFYIVYFRSPYGSYNYALVMDDEVSFPRVIRCGNSIIRHLVNWYCMGVP
jgi:hypothetical protein